MPDCVIINWFWKFYIYFLSLFFPLSCFCNFPLVYFLPIFVIIAFAGIQKRNKVHIKMSTKRNCAQDWGSCKTSRIWCSEEKLQGSSLQLYNNWLCGYFSWSLDFLISTKALERSFCAILKLFFIVWPVEAWESKSREEGKPQCCYWGNKKLPWTANNFKQTSCA